MERESMEFDVVIVGAGPAGLATAIKLKQLCQANDKSLEICVIEKGSEVGAHILSGAVIETRALDELLPDWRDLDSPIKTEVQEDHFLYLTESKAVRLPTPPQMRNHGNYIVSLGQVCRWLASIAESMGVDIFPGFAGKEILYGDDGQVCGIITGDMGISRTGEHKSTFQPGMELRAKQTVFAEGCRGSLTEILIKRFHLRSEQQPQSYGIGIKEVWRVEKEKHQLGKVVHTLGWPLDSKTYGGSFIYHLHDEQVAVGFVVGLDYHNPHLSPFNEMQRFKLHPAIKPLFENGERLYYGARALNEGGLQAIPKLTFPGGMIVGCSAGFLNVAKIKGTHTAMKSGMLAANAIFENIDHQHPANELASYEANMQKSWVWQELTKVRNIRPMFHYGLWPGLIYAAIDTYILRGLAPWTFSYKADHKQLQKAAVAKKIDYPKADGKITFDRLSSLFLSGVQHEEDQPVHLTLQNPDVPISVNYQLYDAPEQRYCPAGVYEILQDENNKPYLQINAQNCVHCKTCDIKDPSQNIKWITPEGGGGPNYGEM